VGFYRLGAGGQAPLGFPEQIRYRRIQGGGDCIQRHDRRIVDATFGSSYDVAVNSGFAREHILGDSQLLASTSNLGADTS
jgi:hypothetical protein